MREEAAQLLRRDLSRQRGRRGAPRARRLSRPARQGDVLTVEFTVLGIPCIGLNGGPAFKHSEAFSFQIATDDQAETDRYWNAIVGNGGAGERVRLVQGQMGPVLADHAARADRCDGDGRRCGASARSRR